MSARLSSTHLQFCSRSNLMIRGNNGNKPKFTFPRMSFRFRWGARCVLGRHAGTPYITTELRGRPRPKLPIAGEVTTHLRPGRSSSPTLGPLRLKKRRIRIQQPPSRPGIDARGHKPSIMKSLYYHYVQVQGIMSIPNFYLLERKAAISQFPEFQFMSCRLELWDTYLLRKWSLK